jgi:hypothetical protein
VNFSLALAETPREILIDGESFLLVKRTALDALYPSTTIDRATRSQAARAASSHPSPKPKTVKAPSSRSPVARAAAAPKPEASKPVNGALRAAVLAAIEQNPGQTSITLFDQIRKTIPSTTIGSVYQSCKALVRKGLVKGQPSEVGTGWHPARSA